jgi:hypothetical protein
VSASFSEAARVGRIASDNFVANGIVHEVSDGMYSEFEHNPCSVGFDCLDADAKDHCHSFVAFPFRQKLSDLSLPRCQTMRWDVAFNVLLDYVWSFFGDRFCNLRREVLFVLAEGVHSCQEIVVSIIF